MNQRNFGLIVLFLIVCNGIFLNVSSSVAQERKRVTGEYFKIPEISTKKIEKMIDAGGRKLHCCVYGKGSPTVVLVTGFGATQSYWNSVVPDLAAQSTVVTYDRAGYGKSERGTLPVHGEQTARDLHILLEKLGVPKPYLPVGHSYGGKIVRLFASLYPEDMGGLILEDSSHEGILEAQKKILNGKDLETLERMTSRRKNVKNPKTENDYMITTREQLRNSGPLPHIPYIVLIAGDRSGALPPVFSQEAQEKTKKLGMEMQKEMANLIPGGICFVVEGVGHTMHMEKPEVLIKPVIEMINEIRNKK